MIDAGPAPRITSLTALVRAEVAIRVVVATSVAIATSVVIATSGVTATSGVLATSGVTANEDGPEVRIIDQPFAINSGDAGPIVIADVAGATPTDTVVVTAYPRTVSRTSFRAVADGDAPLQTTVDAVRFRYGSLRRRDGGLAIPLAYGLTTTKTAALDIGRTGIYPLSVEIRRGDRLVARTLTFLYRPDAGPRVRATVIVGAVTAPGHLPDGSIAIRPDTRLAVQETTAMSAGAAGALVTDLTPELLAALAASTDPADVELLAGLRTAIGGAALPAAPYTRIDPSRLIAEGVGDEIARQIRLGETAVLAALPGATVQRGVYIARSPLGATAAASLADLGVRTVVFSGDARPDVDVPVGLMAGVDAGAGVSVKGVIAVDGTEDLLRDADQPVVGGVRIAADLMMIRADLLAAGHSPDSIHLVVDALPGEGRPDVTSALALAGALRESGAVSIVGETAIDDTDIVDDALITNTADPSDHEDRNMGAVMFTLVTRRQALSSMLPPDNGRLDRWEATLGIVPSLDDPTLINAYVSEMQRDMNTLPQAVSLSVGTTVTLGNRTGRIPLRLRNALDTPLSVRVRVVSAKLVLSDGPRVFEIPANSAIDVSIDVRARSNGSFPVRVTLLTPDGQAVVEPTVTITARVSALAGLGQLVSVSIALVLVAWWLAHWRRSRRRDLTGEIVRPAPR